MAKIAVVGLGNMGAPIARNFLDGGHALSVFDIIPSAISELVEAGAHAAASPAYASQDADFVFTILPASRDVRAAVFGESGIARTLRADALLADMTTGDPLETDAIVSDLAARGLTMVDAAINRSTAHARQKKLLMMVGADAETFARLEPILRLTPEIVAHCGPAGHGVRTKIVVNYLSMTINVATAEALTLAEACGLEVGKTAEVIGSGPIGAFMKMKWTDQVFAGNLKPGFAIDLALKDLTIATALAARLAAPATTGAAARDAYARAREEGRGGDDITAVYLSTRQGAGLPRRTPP